MIPRGSPDISWNDLFLALLDCLLPHNAAHVQANLEAHWATSSLACLSVRSGFDLLLQALKLPTGSEVLVSAITIGDMARVLEHHGLVAVPVDVDPHTLALNPCMAEQAIGPRTRALLVAHLFGSRVPLDALADLAQRHNLYLWEDCAQAYDASTYRGHPASDVSMWSFGPIKTATALGGALLRFKQPALLERVRALQQRYPRQHRWPFAQRIGLFAVLKLLAHPVALAVFVALCRLRGTDHDELLRASVRGFKGNNLIVRLRQQPSAPLLCLLARRLAHPNPAAIERRMAQAQQLLALLPTTTQPGTGAAHHTHWVLPITSARPDTLMQLLSFQGFDATRGASSLVVIPVPAGNTAPEPRLAQALLEEIVYLPVYHPLAAREIKRLARIIGEFSIEDERRKTKLPFTPPSRTLPSIRAR